MNDLMTPSKTPVGALLIRLLKGLVEREREPLLWAVLSENQSQIRDYFSRIGLELSIDEAEGFAFLRQRPQEEGRPELPRLITRRRLSYPVSLLLALLRKRLAEHDAHGGDKRLVLSGIEIVDLVQLFVPDTPNEAKLVKRIGRDINKVIELGFLRRLKKQEDTYEVCRILRSFVDAQWLAGFDERLSEYVRYGESMTKERR